MISSTARAPLSPSAPNLPGMSLLEHLAELRRRIIHSAIYLFLGFCIAWVFHEKIYYLMEKPILIRAGQT